MQVINEIEHEDGSATYTFDLTEQERIIMTQQGILWSIIAGATGVTPEQVFKDYMENKDEEDDTD
jgi:hypothetical protein